MGAATRVLSLPPRYARVNVARASREFVEEQLRQMSDAAQQAGGEGSDAKGLENWRRTGQFVRDELLGDGLFFPPGTDLHVHPLVQAGVLVQQVCGCIRVWVGVGGCVVCHACTYVDISTYTALAPRD